MSHTNLTKIFLLISFVLMIIISVMFLSAGIVLIIRYFENSRNYPYITTYISLFVFGLMECFMLTKLNKFIKNNYY